MADTSSTASQSAPGLAPAQRSAATAAVGQTAIATAGAAAVADVLDWGFACATSHHLVQPDQATTLALASGLIIAIHSINKLFRPKTGRSTDLESTTPTEQPA